MPILDYMQGVTDAIEYLIALGSLVGILGLITGMLFMVIGSKKMRGQVLMLIIASFILLAITGGPYVGIRYFRLHV